MERRITAMNGLAQLRRSQQARVPLDYMSNKFSIFVLCRILILDLMGVFVQARVPLDFVSFFLFYRISI